MAKTPRKAAAKKKAAAPKKAPAAPRKRAVEVASEASGEGVRIDRAKYQYEAHKDVKTASGRASLDNGDAVADALRGRSLDEVMQAVVDSGGEVKDNWANLNQGMARMSAGNTLRGLYRKMGRIKIGGRWLNNPDGASVEKASPAKKGAAQPAAAPRKRRAKAADDNASQEATA